MVKDCGALFKDMGFIFKLIVAILCIICVIIWNVCDMSIRGYSNNASTYVDTFAFSALMVMAAGAYLLIMIVFLIVYIVAETSYWFEVLFLFAGILLNLIYAIAELIISLTYGGQAGRLIVAGCCLASGIIMIFDFIRALKKN